MQKKITEDLTQLLANPQVDSDILELLQSMLDYYSVQENYYNSSSCLVTVPLLGNFLWRSESPNFQLFEYLLKNSNFKLKKVLTSQICQIEQQLVMYFLQKSLCPKQKASPEFVLSLNFIAHDLQQYYSISLKNESSDSLPVNTDQGAKLRNADPVSLIQNLLLSTLLLPLEPTLPRYTLKNE
jgi:hypothetical protein